MPIYKARNKDINDLIALSEVWDIEEENLMPTSPQKLEENINDGMVFLYRQENEDDLLGAMILDETYDTIFLKTIYVHPEYRSEGIGKEMMESFTDMLNNRSMKAFLEVEEHSPAIQLYESFGFEEDIETKVFDGHIAMSREPD